VRSEIESPKVFRESGFSGRWLATLHPGKNGVGQKTNTDFDLIP
jgi:hypothetical protein